MCDTHCFLPYGPFKTLLFQAQKELTENDTLQAGTNKSLANVWSSGMSQQGEWKNEMFFITKCLF